MEMALSTSTTSKIGLLYIHDYYYAYQSDGLNCSGAGAYSTCKTSWIHLSNNDTSAPETSYEWIIQRFGYYSNAYQNLAININGSIGMRPIPYSLSVRPVFYVKSNEGLKGGNGTITDPFIIS